MPHGGHQCSDLKYGTLPGAQVRRQKEGLARLASELRAATPGTSVTEADLAWALQAVRSRAFSGPYAGAHAMCIESRGRNERFAQWDVLMRIPGAQGPSGRAGPRPWEQLLPWRLPLWRLPMSLLSRQVSLSLLQCHQTAFCMHGAIFASAAAIFGE